MRAAQLHLSFPLHSHSLQLALLCCRDTRQVLDPALPWVTSGAAPRVSASQQDLSFPALLQIVVGNTELEITLKARELKHSDNLARATFLGRQGNNCKSTSGPFSGSFSAECTAILQRNLITT